MLSDRTSLRKRREQYLIYVLIAFAVFTRLLQYFHNRSLWMDEASLALNIKARDFAGLMQPLDFAQGAPVPFLWVTKLLYSLFGSSEYVLRFVPLVAGILAIFLLWQLCLRVASKAAPVALAFFATSSTYIYYAAEFKQYSVDVAIALGLLLIGLQLLDTLQPCRLIQAAIIGAVVVWCSHPSIFVLAGIGMILLAHTWQNNRRDVPAVIAVGAVWVMSFALAYLVFYRQLSANSELTTYWQEDFFRLDISSFFAAFFEMMTYISGFYQPGLLIFCITGLLIGLSKVSRLKAGLLLSPIPFVLLAALLRMYPFSGRLILFLIPGVLVIVAAGIREMIDALWRTSRYAGMIGAVFLMLILVIRTDFVQNKVEIRNMYYNLQQREPETDIYTDNFLARVFRYYDFPYQPFSDPQPIDKPIWVVADKMTNATQFVQLETVARQVDEVHLPGVDAYRYVPLESP